MRVTIDIDLNELFEKIEGLLQAPPEKVEDESGTYCTPEQEDKPLDQYETGKSMFDDEAAPTPPPADIDVNGEIWDEGVHSSSKAKLKDGSWKKKRKAKADDDAPTVNFNDVVNAIATNSIDALTLDAALNEFGLASLPEVATKPGIMADLVERLNNA